MVRADLFVFGYRKIDFLHENSDKIATLLLRSDISATLEFDFFYLQNSDFLRIKDKISPLICRVSEPLGVPSILRRVLSARGALAGLATLILLFCFLVPRVWDIRVSSDGTVREAAVIDALSSEGFAVGTPWSGINLSELENRLLLSSEEISWISINRRGSVAYVEVISKNVPNAPESEGGYSNVVAAFDCVIDEITVSSGVAVVSVGDAVSKGDLLISGVLPDEVGGGYCRASGTVRGRTSVELSSFCGKEEVEKRAAGRDIQEISLNFFDFSLNIFKKYGNVDNSCDIIKDIEELIVLGKYRLPISVTKTYSVCYDECEVYHSDSELAEIAFSRLNSLIKSELYASDVVSLKTGGEFTERGYRAFAALTVISDVAKNVNFEIVEK